MCLAQSKRKAAIGRRWVIALDMEEASKHQSSFGHIQTPRTGTKNVGRLSLCFEKDAGNERLYGDYGALTSDPDGPQLPYLPTEP